MSYKMYFLPKLFQLHCLVIIILEFWGQTAACGSLNKFLKEKKYQFTDLSFSVPKKTGVSVSESDDELDDDWYVESDSHTTHLKFGKKVEDIPLQNFMVSLVFADFSSKVNGNPHYTVSLDDFKSVLDNDTWTQINDQPSLLMINFGWTTFYYKDHEKYMGVCKDNATSVCLPAISPEAVNWMMSKYVNHHLVGIASDRPIIEDLRDLHQQLMLKGLYLVYGLNLNTSLPSRGCTAVTSPLKVQSTTKTFANMVALCPKDTKTGSENKSESSGGHKSHNSRKCMKHNKHSNHEIDQHIDEEIKEHYTHEMEQHNHEDKEHYHEHNHEDKEHSHKHKEHNHHNHEHNHEDKEHSHKDKEHNHEDKEHSHKDKEHSHKDKEHNHEDKQHQTQKPQKVTTQSSSTESPNSHEVENSKDKHKFSGPVVGFLLSAKDKLKFK